jgi:hypothetical protein
MLDLEQVMARTQELYSKARDGRELQSEQVKALAQAVVEAVNNQIAAIVLQLREVQKTARSAEETCFRYHGRC